MKNVLIIATIVLSLLACAVLTHLMQSGTVDLPNVHGAIAVMRWVG